MLHEWDRFLYWLGQGQNAAATQALAGLAALLVSVLTAYITIKYVQITRRQYAASLQPDVTVGITFQAFSVPQSFDCRICNNSKFPIRIRAIRIQYLSTIGGESITETFTSGPIIRQVIPAAAEIPTKITPERTINIAEKDYVIYSQYIIVTVDFEDIAGGTNHCVSASGVLGARYWPSFHICLPWYARRLRRFSDPWDEVLKDLRNSQKR